MKKKLFLLLFVFVSFQAIAIFSSTKKKKKALPRPYLTVIGPVQMADGIGKQSIEVIDALKERVSIGFIPTGHLNLHGVPSAVKKIVQKKNKKLGHIVLFEAALWLPNTFDYQLLESPRNSDQIRIAYSMTESTAIPDEWTFILNHYFDAVAVPDPFLIEVYQNSGVKIPIFLLPLGRNLKPFLEYPKTEKSGPFTFGNFSACLDRKNHLTLIRAFSKAFGNNPKVHLTLNMRVVYNQELYREIREEIENNKLTNVTLTTLELNQSSYLNLMNELDCYVSLSKAEGFSIPPREALAMEIPVIATDNTAQSTICQSGFVRSVQSEKKEPAYFELMQKTVGNRFVCSVDEAAQAMLDVYENYSKYQEKAKRGKKWASQCDFSNLTPLYCSLIAPKRVLLGESNCIGEDFLVTNSPDLYNKYLHINSLGKRKK